MIRKHPQATFQLFRRFRYWWFCKGTKTRRIRFYSPLRYAIPKNVGFTKGNSRFRVVKSEVDFRRGIKKHHKVVISFVESTEGNIVVVCKRLREFGGLSPLTSTSVEKFNNFF